MKAFSLSLLFLLLLVGTAVAELPAQIKADFAPHSGHLIMPVGSEYLVDLDAFSNLQKGDILTLISPGEKILQSGTKKILGSLDLPKGYLQVTRIKSGYSYARLLLAEQPPQKGDQVRRFEQVPAQFNDPQGNGAAIGRQLQQGLPQLTWLGPDSPLKPLLIFSLEQDRLLVRTTDGSLLHSYAVVDGQLGAPIASPTDTTTGKKRPGLLKRMFGGMFGFLHSKETTDSAAADANASTR